MTGCTVTLKMRWFNHWLQQCRILLCWQVAPLLSRWAGWTTGYNIAGYYYVDRLHRYSQDALVQPLATTLQDTIMLTGCTVTLKMRWFNRLLKHCRILVWWLVADWICWFKVRLKTRPWHSSDCSETSYTDWILSCLSTVPPNSARILLPLRLQILPYTHIISNSLLTKIRCCVAGVSQRFWRWG